MNAIVQDNYGSAEVLQLRNIDKPEIGDHEVLIRVQAAGVNPADWAIMNGLPSATTSWLPVNSVIKGERASGGRLGNNREQG